MLALNIFGSIAIEPWNKRILGFDISQEKYVCSREVYLWFKQNL